MNVTLRIKKNYFDQILSGYKTIEYRDVRPYYERLFAREIKTLTLHYQRSEKLVADVLSIKKIKTPHFFSNHSLGFGSHTFAISLANARLVQ